MPSKTRHGAPGGSAVVVDRPGVAGNRRLARSASPCLGWRPVSARLVGPLFAAPPDLGCLEPTVPPHPPDRCQLSGPCPAGHRLGVHPHPTPPPTGAAPG